jgi:hypothetical protein
MSPRFAAVIAVVAACALPQMAAAQETGQDARTPSLAASVSANPVQFANEQAPAPVREFRTDPRWTTPVLISLQATTIVTQMLDVHSTMKAVNAGGVEGNPIMGGLVNNKAAFLTVKAGVAAGVIYITHRVARDNKMAAIAASAAINSAFLMVARHNYRVAQGLQ